MTQIAAAFRSLRTGEGLKGQLLRGGVGSIAVKIASTLINVLLAIVLARLLGAEGFGVYSFIFAIVTIMAIPAQMGLPNLVVRETAKAQADGRWDVMKGLWRWASFLAFAISLVLIGAGVAAAWAFSSRLTPEGLAAFYWGLALVPLVALGNLRGAALRGLRHVVQGQLPEFLLRPAFLIGLVLLAHLGLADRALTAGDAMMLHAVASLLAFIIGAAMLLRARPAELSAEPAATTHWRPWLAATLPLAMTQGMQLINQHIGVIMLGTMAGAAEAGFFRVAFQGGMLVAFGLTAINMVVVPHFARLHAMGDLARLQRLVTLGARAALLTALPIGLAYMFFGRQILALLFGEQFEGAYSALVLLTLGHFANAFAGSVGGLLNMTGHERDVFWAVALAGVANVVLAFLLVPVLGVEGAATANMASLVIWNTLLVLRSRQRLRIDSTAIGRVQTQTGLE